MPTTFNDDLVRGARLKLLSLDFEFLFGGGQRYFRFAARGRLDGELPLETFLEGSVPLDRVPEQGERRDLGVGLVPDRHVVVHEVIDLAGDLLGPHDDEPGIQPHTEGTFHPIGSPKVCLFEGTLERER